MLSKEICEQCEHSHHPLTGTKRPKKERGGIVCYPTIDEYVPVWCPYSLEHLLENQSHAE